MAIFLADMPPLPPRPPKQHAQISWLAKGGRFYLFSLSRRPRDETSFGSCSGGEDVAPLALLASLGLTTTLVHENKHEGQHRGKNDRRASQDTNSDQIQLLCPGGPLQIEVKGHLNANIMAWYCKGVDMGVK